MSPTLITLIILACILTEGVQPQEEEDCTAEKIRCELICQFEELGLQCTRCQSRIPMRFGKRTSALPASPFRWQSSPPAAGAAGAAAEEEETEMVEASSVAPRPPPPPIKSSLFDYLYQDRQQQQQQPETGEWDDDDSNDSVAYRRRIAKRVSSSYLRPFSRELKHKSRRMGHKTIAELRL